MGSPPAKVRLGRFERCMFIACVCLRFPSEKTPNDANLDLEMKKDFKTDFNFKQNVEIGYLGDLVFFLVVNFSQLTFL